MTPMENRLLTRLSKVLQIAASVLLLMGVTSPIVAASPPTNVVIILADDLGYGELGCQGHPDFKTPHLDRMAAEGARLTSFYTPMPWCAPTRASLLTGRYPFRHGLTSNPAPDASPALDQLHLDPTEVLLADLLHQAGYATACVGKWHLGHHPPFLPNQRGFDRFFGILYSNDMRPVSLMADGETVESPVRQETLTQRYTEQAVAFIEAQQQRPFFLYVAHAMPHKPLAASEAYHGRSGAGLYGDAIAELDASVGGILAALKKNGLEDNTLVVFTSDNGPWLGGSTGGLRGMKGKSWEGGVRVPMIARWPGHIPAGRVIDAEAGIIDLFPTVLNLAGVPPPQDRVIDGKDLMPLLDGKMETLHEGIVIMTADKVKAIRSGRWKLHVEAPGKWPDSMFENPGYIDPRSPDGVTILAPPDQPGLDQYPGVRGGIEERAGMLFDLEADRSESRDVSAQHPEVVARLKALLTKLQSER